MAERAHPDDPGFRDKLQFKLRRGFFPWISYNRNQYRREFFWRYRWVSKHCKNRDVLEVPCGMGWGTSLFGDCKSIIGIDISQEAIKEATARYSDHARFLVGDMCNLPFRGVSFDVVACLEGIEHVTPRVGEFFISEAARVLNAEGMLFLSSPHCITGEHSGNPYHVYEYKPQEIIALVEKKFDIVKVISRRVDKLVISYIQARKRG
jgi:ubiquinone/menaquinone biosynthesis C-methylase UbiE